MKITRVTFTGADDATPVSELLTLGRSCPFVEWGLLMSIDRRGKPRYPSNEWLKTLLEDDGQTPLLSAHLCGHLARGLVLDQVLRLDHTYRFSRVQINLPQNLMGHINLQKLADVRLMTQGRPQFILQYRGTESEQQLVAQMPPYGRKAFAVLFDKSGGLGISPEVWPSPLPNVFCGYAGGLGPFNLAEELTKIASVAGDAEIWIDMETRIRTHDKFDLDKVRKCIEVVEHWM